MFPRKEVENPFFLCYVHSSFTRMHTHSHFLVLGDGSKAEKEKVSLLHTRVHEKRKKEMELKCTTVLFVPITDSSPMWKMANT